MQEVELFNDLQSYNIGENTEIKNNIEVPKARYDQIISLEQVLKSFLENEDVLDVVIKSCLKPDTEIISNVIQGKLWKEIVKNYQGKIWLPYFSMIGNCCQTFFV